MSMGQYADSSFLVSCSILDANTARTKAWVSHAAPSLFFTALHTLEVRNAFRLGVLRRLLSASDAAAARRNLETDARAGAISPHAGEVAGRVGLDSRTGSALKRRQSVGAATPRAKWQLLCPDDQSEALQICNFTDSLQSWAGALLKK